MTGHLRAIEPQPPATRLSTQEEISSWCAERMRVLSALVEAEALDRQDQLELGQAA